MERRERRIVEFENAGEVHFKMNAKLGNERVWRDAERKKNNTRDLIDEEESGRAR